MSFLRSAKDRRAGEPGTLPPAPEGEGSAVGDLHVLHNQATGAGSADILARVVATALDEEGTSWDSDLHPKKSPNFIYELLLPAWSTNNQLVTIDVGLSQELASQLLDDRRYVPDPEAMQRLVALNSNEPNRKTRLKKLITDAINGQPDGGETMTPFERVLLGRGIRAKLRPTDELVETIYRNAYGWQVLEPFLDDPYVIEIMTNAYDRIFVERSIPGEPSITAQIPARFESPAVYHDFVKNVAQKAAESDINEETSPTVDFTLPSGERVNATLPPASLHPSLTIRRRRAKFYPIEELQGLGSLSTEMVEFLSECNEVGANMITYGPTGSGKTTLLTALLDQKPRDRRLVIIEDTPEINIETHDRHPNTVMMLTTPHREMRDLVRNALRQRPDHLIVGETRDKTAFDLIQAFQSGQTGSMSTLHARDAQSALVRLTNLVRMAEAAPNEQPARRMVSEAIHLLIHAAKFLDGRRRVTMIDEVAGLDENFDFLTRPVFRFHQEFDAAGKLVGERHDLNPDYVMGGELARLFYEGGRDPNRWLGEAARAAGRTVEREDD